MSADPEWVVDFPTLWIVPDWIERHCVVPNGFFKGAPFVMYERQLWWTVNHYRVKPTARLVTDPDEPPLRGAAFWYRRSQIVDSQKTGKGPWAASIVCAEAVGPVLFAGWASEGDEYRCSDHGCACGWTYRYDEGEPMGQHWPTPLIQLMAANEDQVANVYRPLQQMIALGPLADRMLIREGFIRLPNDGQIDVVTSSARGRLGNPITFALQDETGIYTKTNKLSEVARTMRRSLAGMSGRSVETTNCWDPAQDSTAQQTYESPVMDVFKYYRKPPANLSYRNKAERRKIHAFNYQGIKHIDLDSIEGEAFELMERDPEEAERFFGNRIVYGKGVWLPEGLWESCYAEGLAA